MKGFYFMCSILLPLLFTSCAPGTGQTPECLTFDTLYTKKNNPAMKISIEGYAAIVSSVSLKSPYLNGRLFEKTQKAGRFISIILKIGTGKNQAEKLPVYFKDKDLKIHTNGGEVAGVHDKVRITGTRYYHDKDNTRSYYISVDLIEKAE
jgi:hypothetical protein